jgi:hypothetical protein
MSERGAQKGNSLKDWTAKKSLLPPKHVMRNGSLAYVAAERQELEKLPFESAGAILGHTTPRERRGAAE